MQRFTVIHVDDDPDHRLIVACTMEDHAPEHVNFQQFDSPAAADATVGKLEGPAIVISDHVMPGEMGASFLSRHAASLKERGIPCYLLTSYPDDPEVLAAVEAGVTGVLAKPVMFDAFEAVLLGVLQPAWSD